MSDPQKVTYLGQVDYRNKSLTFGIKENDRTRHMYIIGKTGMGKSTLLENMSVQDIKNGEGLCVIDPHGSFAERILEYIPQERIQDVIYFAPFDTDYPFGLNVLEKVEMSKRHLVANGLMSAFKKIFGEERFSDRIQYILNNIILALLENENESLLGVNRMLIDKEYRKYIISNVKDPSVRSFWLEEYVKAGDKYQQEAAPGIQNKIGQFISNPLIRNIIGQQRTSFDIREIMDKKKILIVNLSKGKVGEGNANLIGSLLITKIYLAAMSRADVGIHELEKLPPFYLYVDEFQNFANESFANILSEARKYNLALTVAHQYVEQMTDEVKAAVFGNVGSMIVFRVGATDAEIFEKEFAPYFILDDIVNLGFTQIYLRLMIDGVGSKPFSAKTLSRIKPPEKSYVADIISQSRKVYAKKVVDAEDEIKEWYMPKMVAPVPKLEDSSFQEIGTSVMSIKREDTSSAPRREERSNEGRFEQKNGERRNERGEDRRREEGRRDGPRKTVSPITHYNNEPKTEIEVPKVFEVKKVEELKEEKREEKKEERRVEKKEESPVVQDVSPSIVLSPEKELVKSPEVIFEKKEQRNEQREERREEDREVKTEVQKDERKVEGNVSEKTTSLKDALLRAMKEKELEIIEEVRALPRTEFLKEKEENKTSVLLEKDTPQEIAKQKEVSKEISEDILRPLVDDPSLKEQL